MKGTIFQRKDGRWVGAVDLGKDLEGKRKKKYVYAKTKKEASVQLNDLMYKLQNNIYRNPGNIDLKSYFEEWYNQNTNMWESTTLSLYRMYLDKHIYPLLGNIKLKDLLPAHINDYKNKMLEKYSPNTVNKYLSFLSMALKSAVENNLILSNPVDNVKRLEKIKYKPRIYNEKQFTELLDHVSGTFDEVPILLAGACGLRRGEIFGLRWGDVDFGEGTLIVEQTLVRYSENTLKNPKNQTSSRVIKIPKFVIDVLNRYRQTMNVIGINYKQSQICERYKPQSYSERFSKLLEKFGMPHIRLHDLRHYNAVIMMKYGVADKVAAGRLGHSNTQTLREVYQHVLTDMDEAAADVINDVFMKARN